MSDIVTSNSVVVLSVFVKLLLPSTLFISFVFVYVYILFM